MGCLGSAGGGGGGRVVRSMWLRNAQLASGFGVSEGKLHCEEGSLRQVIDITMVPKLRVRYGGLIRQSYYREGGSVLWNLGLCNTL